MACYDGELMIYRYDDRELRMYDEAAEEYLKILRIHPEHIKATYNLGRIYCQLGNYREAVEKFERVLQLDPRYADAWNNLGSVYELQKDYSKAIEAYRNALIINPFHEDTNVNLSYIQYLILKLHPDKINKSDVIRRLHFVRSLNPHNTKVDKLLNLIENTT